MGSKKQKERRDRQKINKRIRKQLEREKERLRKIRVAFPEMFKVCDANGTPCCQAATSEGVQCKRPALTTRTYYQRVRCCYLCWQQEAMYGVYGILATCKGG